MAPPPDNDLENGPESSSNHVPPDDDGMQPQSVIYPAKPRQPLARLVHWAGRYPGLWLLLGAAVLLLLQSPQQSVMAHDEGYYGQQARWMLESGDWVTVGWWGDLVFDRTPGVQWLIALCFSGLGINEFALRLPSLVASLGAVGLTWHIGQRLSPKVGRWGAAIVAVMPLWVQASCLGTQDMVLVCLELLAIWSLLQLEAQAHRRWPWGLVAGAALGLGVLVKTVMVVLPVVALMPYLIRSHRQHRHLLNPSLYLGFILGLVPFCLWLGAATERYGLLPVQQLLGKVWLLSQANNPSATAETFGSTSTWAYYLWHLPAVTFPWLLLAVGGAVVVGRTPALGRRSLWLGYPAVLLVALSLFDTRTWYYPLQLYPFIALLAAVGLEQMGGWWRSRRPLLQRSALGVSWALGVVAVVLGSAGLALLVAPGLPAEIRPYGWLALLGGLGWLVPWLVGIQRPSRRAIIGLWTLGWLLGPWLGIAAVQVTGLWGNYGADFKLPLQREPLAPVLATQTVHVVQPNATRPWVLLTFYTPTLGQRVVAWEEVPAGGYAWGNGAIPLPDGAGYRVVGTVADWQLVQVP